MKLLSVILFVFVGRSAAVIYRLNASEYYRMPAVTRMEPYESCMAQPAAVYCTADLAVVADHPTDLFTMMQEYSEHMATHFNRTQLFYGVCITNTCKEFHKTNKNLTQTLEACVNKTLWDEYQLKSRVIKIYGCDHYGDLEHVDTADIVVAALLLLILMLNVIGSIFGFYCISDSKQENNLLLCFSISHNWRRLVRAPNPDPEVARFRSFNGIRTLTMMLVIFGHAFLPSALTASNEYEFEQMYDSIGNHIFFNGNLIVQTFFVMSGLFLMTKVLSYSEENELSWRLVPQGIAARWLRLTPLYAVILAFTTTWMRFGGSGPMWNRMAGIEIVDCRREWFYNLLYVNNYIDDSQCMTQTWYLACDMQLHILGLIILAVVQSSRGKKIALGSLFTVGLLTPFIHTYVQDLNAVLISSPSLMTSFFVTDPTFNNVYKRSHTNIVNFALGLASGWVVHAGLKKKIDENHFKKYRYLVWMSFPMLMVLVCTGAVFYWTQPQPVLLRAAYATLVKLLFGVGQALIMMACIFKVENLYRGILEWPGWTTLARLSYCGYLLHIMMIRTLGGRKTALTHVTILQINMEVCGVICLTLLLAVPLWLLVECPMSLVVKRFLEPTPEKTDVNMNEPKSKIDK